MQTDR